MVAANTSASKEEQPPLEDSPANHALLEPVVEGTAGSKGPPRATLQLLI